MIERETEEDTPAEDKYAVGEAVDKEQVEREPVEISMSKVGLTGQFTL